MRVAGITALGEPVEIFEVDELAAPSAGEVLIDVVAAGIGNWDDLVRIGSWQVGGPGSDGARDERCRDGRSGRFRRGRAARGRRRDDTSAAAAAPRHVGEQVARAGGVSRGPAARGVMGGEWSVPIPALTAAQALDEALEIESGGWVVVNGAGGVTGGLLVQLAALEAPA